MTVNQNLQLHFYNYLLIKKKSLQYILIYTIKRVGVYEKN